MIEIIGVVIFIVLILCICLALRDIERRLVNLERRMGIPTKPYRYKE